MRKSTQKQPDPNDVPVIFSYDQNGQLTGKLSINEWRKQKQEAQLLEEVEIKLYREAITYYSDNDLSKAEDILRHLIARTAYTRYEYVERLANIYRKQKRFSIEKELLLTARKNSLSLDFSEGILRRINKRLQKIEEKMSLNGSPIFI
ncbi:hypothetical protein [Enterococcus olivae]